MGRFLHGQRYRVRPAGGMMSIWQMLATGGTIAAKCALVEELGGVVAGIAVVVELTFLPGRARLPEHEVMSLVQYDSEDVGAV